MAFEICSCWSDQEAYGGLLKLEINVGTWCMDRSIVTGSFLSWNSATGK